MSAPKTRVKTKHKKAQEAVNRPPSRNPELMRRMYSLLVALRKQVPEAFGLEATYVGSLMGLLPEDSLTISHAGGLQDALFGRPAKKHAPELLDFAPIDAAKSPLDTSTQIAIAAGYALDRLVHHKPGIVLAFAGEAASLEGCRDTLTFAATHKLPLMMVIQHNLAQLKKSDTVADLSHSMLGVGMAGMTVDGNDAMAVYRVTQEAMYRARHDGGPTLIECKTYCTKSGKTDVAKHLRAWVQEDPIAYMEQQLRARGFWLEK